VYDGVTHAAKLYPNAYIIMILIGTLKGELQFLLLCWSVAESSLKPFVQACFYVSPFVVKMVSQGK
jgi:hypothetical protein